MSWQLTTAGLTSGTKQLKSDDDGMEQLKWGSISVNLPRKQTEFTTPNSKFNYFDKTSNAVLHCDATDNTKVDILESQFTAGRTVKTNAMEILRPMYDSSIHGLDIMGAPNVYSFAARMLFDQQGRVLNWGNNPLQFPPNTVANVHYYGLQVTSTRSCECSWCQV